jgi:NitT/TauT family transport system permease protein
MKFRKPIFLSATRLAHFLNYWDVAALVLVIGIFFTLGSGLAQFGGQYHPGQTLPISLHANHLPGYALRTVLRMGIAILLSLLFTFTLGTLAAKNRHAERIIIPLVDILQSVPILGFLSITVMGFIALFPGSIIGPECACIFAIFTSQAWNMLLGFYQTLRSVPSDLKEAADMFHLSPWQRFWRIEVPHSIPSLLWNSMMSMSAGWFFVVASEAISVANHSIKLPGIGSYIAVAISSADKAAIAYAILTMFIVILLYDQLIFRPLIAWSEKFKSENQEEGAASSWLISLFRRTKFFHHIGRIIGYFAKGIVNLSFFRYNPNKHRYSHHPSLPTRLFPVIFYGVLFCLILLALLMLSTYILNFLTVKDIVEAIRDGLVTGLRVLILVIISTLIWVPIGVWIGFRPRVAAFAQPIAQFLASFPANLLFPIFVYFIATYSLNVNIWVTPLMILGTQWYILFNVIAGASSIPKELRQTAAIFGLSPRLLWKRLILPGIFPYYITGAMTAAGGAWNASIVAEVVSWGHQKYQATGLGAYIANATTAGDFPKIALGITVMCLFVLLINRLVWKPLYNIASERFQLE